MFIVSFDQTPQVITSAKIKTALAVTLPQHWGLILKSGLEVADLLLVLKQ